MLTSVSQEAKLEVLSWWEGWDIHFLSLSLSSLSSCEVTLNLVMQREQQFGKIRLTLASRVSKEGHVRLPLPVAAVQ